MSNHTSRIGIGLLAVLLLASACGELPDPVAPIAAAARTTAGETAILGNRGLAFLPPLAAPTAAAAPFDGAAAPSIVICRLASDTDPAASCAGLLATFTSDAVDPRQLVSLDIEDEQYHANWRVECPAATCGPAALARITVTTGRHVRGSIVVRLLNGNGAATGNLPMVKVGRTLPIKFRVEQYRFDPEWVTLAASPVEPTIGTAMTHVPDESAIYAIVGGGDYQPHSLWRLDLTTDAWSEISTSDFPIGKYRSVVHDPVHHQLLTYWDGRGQVWAVSEAGGAWQPVGSEPDQQEWYQGAAFWHPVQNRLALFGGYGFFHWQNTLFEFDREASTWSLTDQSATRPWPRFATQYGLDEAGNVLYMEGGQGYPSGSQFDGTYLLNDTWRLDLATNSWTQLVPYDPAVTPHMGSALDVVPPENALYRFAGTLSADDTHPVNDLYRLDLTSASPKWEPVATAGTPPTPRTLPAMYFDAPRKRLVVIGGFDPSRTRLDTYALMLP